MDESIVEEPTREEAKLDTGITFHMRAKSMLENYDTRQEMMVRLQKENDILVKNKKSIATKNK